MPQPSSGRSSGFLPAARRAAGLLAALVATSVGLGALGAAVLVPGVAAAGTATKGTVEVFNELPVELTEQPLSQQSRILYADGSLMATFFYQNRIVVGLDRIAQPMKDAIVAIEDSRFYEHGGVDPKGMGRAAVVNAVRPGSATQGASTLTQQWIKNVLIEQAVSTLPSSATVAERQEAAKVATESEGTAGYARKLREVKLAIAAEKQLSKDEILQRYLNIADFGDGQYGVETAARHYLNKSAADLAVVDAALLAGIVQSPVALNPIKNPVDSTNRRNTVLGRMLELGKIDQATHDAAVATPLEAQLLPQPTPNGCSMAGSSGFFCDFAVRQLLNDPAFGEDLDARRRALYRGGLTITTTLDPVKQQAAIETVNARVPNDGSDVAASIVSVEPGTGRVVAMAQNRDYTTEPDAPSTATSINYNVDKASGGGSGWQPGSNFKPFVLATWLASGRTLLEEVESPKARTWPGRAFRNGACNPGGQVGEWKVSNTGDGIARDGRISVLGATFGSVNTAYSAIEQQLPLCDVQATASALGVKKAADGSPVDLVMSMTLGVDDVAPLAMANAYAAFAAQGLYCTPVAVAAVTDSAGQPLPTTPTACTQALSPDVANGVTYALKETLVRGTARGQALDGRVAAGKTGTTQNSWDTWFTGYTPNLSTAVWLGHAASRYSLSGATIGGRTYGTIYGGTIAAPVWREYMNRALAGAPAPGFVDPPRSVIGSPPAPPKPTQDPSAPRSPAPSSSSSSPEPSPTSEQAPPPPEEPSPSGDPSVAAGAAIEPEGDGDGGDGGGDDDDDNDDDDDKKDDDDDDDDDKKDDDD